MSELSFIDGGVAITVPVPELPKPMTVTLNLEAPPQLPVPPRTPLPNLPHRALGIDAARYQERIDFAKAREAGVTFAILKATEGHNYTDPTFVVKRRDGEAAGMPLGEYHFFRPDTRTPIAQIAHIEKTFGDNWGAMGLWVDVENPVINGKIVDPATYAQTIEGDLRTLMDGLEAIRPQGANLGMYTGAGYWDSLLPRATDLLNQYPCWIANYPYNYTDAYKPRLPRGMNPEQLKIWQFDNGEMTWSKKVPGVTNAFGLLTKVDRNFFWKP